MRLLPRLTIALLILMTLSIATKPAYATDATVSTCDFASLSAAVTTANTGGGTITFACSGTIVFDTILIIADNVTINANGNTVIFDEIGDDNQFFAVNGVGTLTLNGLTLQNANALQGGAIFSSGTVTIINSTFAGNSAEYGGAIYSANGIVIINNSTFVGNSAIYAGGVINNANNNTLTITDSTFIGNSATNGGAIYKFRNGPITISNSTFIGNSATEGGAIYRNGDGSISSDNSYYENNTCFGTITDNGGNLVNNAAGCPGDEVVIPPAPTPAVTVLGCALDSTDGVEVANAPDDTYCRVLMKNGGVVSYSGAIPADLIGLGVVLAVDVYRLQGGMTVNTFPDYARVCLAGSGRLFYMDGRNAPRVSVELATEAVDNLTCGWIPAPGTLILTN